MVLATAHPAKFPSVYECSGMQIPRADVLEALLSIEPSKYQLGVVLPKFGPLLKVLPESAQWFVLSEKKSPNESHTNSLVFLRGGGLGIFY